MESTYLFDVSVIIPIHNPGKRLTTCLNTLAKQSFKGKYEVILINDDSTDESSAIIDIFSAKYPEIFKRFDVQYHSAGLARQEGINHAQGEYLAFVDSDDFVLPTFISLSYKKAKLTNADVLITSYLTSKDTHQSAPLSTRFKKDGFISQKAIIKDTLQCTWLQGFIWNKFIKSSIIKDNHIQFCSEANVAEDLLFSYQVLSNAKVIYYYSKRTYVYNIVDKSLSHCNPEKMLQRLINTYVIMSYLHKMEETTYRYYHFPSFLKGWMFFGYVMQTKDMKISKCKISKQVKKQLKYGLSHFHFTSCPWEQGVNQIGYTKYPEEELTCKLEDLNTYHK